MKNRHKVPVADHAGPLHLAGFAGINLDKFRAVRRRAKDLRMEHPRKVDVPRVFRLPGDLLARVPPGEGFAHDLEFRRLLDDHRVGEVTLDLFPLCQRGIGNAGLRICPVEHRATFRRKILHRDFELLRGHLDQDPPRLRACGPQRGAKRAGTERTKRPPVPRTEIRVPHDHVDVIDTDVHFVGEHLGQGRDDPLSHLDLAGITCHAAVLTDSQVCIEIRRDILL